MEVVLTEGSKEAVVVVVVVRREVAAHNWKEAAVHRGVAAHKVVAVRYMEVAVDNRLSSQTEEAAVAAHKNRRLLLHSTTAVHHIPVHVL